MRRIFNNDNIEVSVDNLLKKNDSCGSDGIYISDFEEYWKLNGEHILGEVCKGVYTPDVIQIVEIVNKNGKKRNISKYTCTDRVILDAIKRELDKCFSSVFSQYSYAYQQGKGIHAAVVQAAKYIENGNIWVVELDIKDFFDNIDIEQLLSMLRTQVENETLLNLIKKYLYCRIQKEYEIERKARGVVQGSPISPLLSNIYMMELDLYLEKRYSFCRYSDNINLYCRTEDEALFVMQEVQNFLSKSLKLVLNMRKSGVYEAINRPFLGYEFYRKNRDSHVYVKKVKNRVSEYMSKWKTSAVQKFDRNYYIIDNGILSRRDYTLLFENPQSKRYMPVEICDSLNIYSNVIFSSNFFEYANKKKIQINIFDKYGQYVGTFYTGSHYATTNILIKQVMLYNDICKRVIIAKEIEEASLHNQRANLRYFYKKYHKEKLSVVIEKMTQAIENVKKCKEIEEILLYEAQGKQKYLQAIDMLVNNPDYRFNKRTRRPPENEINAMLSFGNVFLYQRIANKIRRTPLDIRIGFVHASNQRTETLNLDVAEIFKPIIVDRAIFTLLNRYELNVDRHFISEGKAVLLSDEGKRIFIEKMEENLYRKITVGKKTVTYDRLIDIEIKKLLSTIDKNEKYKAYKYS